MTNTPDRLIITGASKAYGPSLLALLGSLTLNWPDHPPVLVYDIGLDETTRAALGRHGVKVRTVPPFCPHWRKHFTWKIWCWNDAPARDVFWLDSGIAVLRPMEEVFSLIERQGFFAVSNAMPLSLEASEAACRGCGVAPAFRDGRRTIASGIVGFRKDGRTGAMLAEALRVALIEENIAATSPHHRHDQAILSLLMYRDLDQVHCADRGVYLAGRSPRRDSGQKIWVHRRGMRSSDLAHFAAHISTPGAPYLPKTPIYWRTWLPLYRVRKWLGARHSAFIYDGVKD
jgi:hypothetical protein